MIMTEWLKMKPEERVEYMLTWFSHRGEGRYAVFYKDKMLWFGNKGTFKTEGIARRQLMKNVDRNVLNSEPIINKLLDNGTITIKKV